MSTEDRAGLVVAVGLHVALFAALAFQFAAAVPPPPEPVERVVVSLSQEVGLTSTAPEPVLQSRAATAPTLSDAPAPPSQSEPAQPEPAQSEPAPAQPTPARPAQTVIPRTVATTAPAPRATVAPRAVETPRPRPTTKPSAKPSKPAEVRPTARASSLPTQKAAAKPASKPASKPSSKPVSGSGTKPAAKPAAKPSAASGGTRIGNDFLPGAGTSTTSSETRAPASQIGASARASLLSQITREVKPRFDPPSGVEVEKLVSVVRFRLNEKAALIGKPSLVRQSGITDANKPQAARHAELAIRAVELAAPFDLPPEYYEAYKSVTLNFDASL